MRPTIIKGWDISKEVYLEADKQKKLVKLCIELGTICNLDCKGCFTKNRDKTTKRLSFEEIIDLVQIAKNLGIKTIDIIGAGEPTINRHFYKLIDLIESELNCVVFTNLYKPFKLSEKSYYVIKLWGYNEDDYVGRRGYSASKYKELELLLDQGLNLGTEIEVDGIHYLTTRLGADILVRNSNYQQVLNLFRLCRKNNIMPMIVDFIPNTEFEKKVSKEELSKLYQQIIKIDHEEFGIENIKTFYPQGSKCTQSIGSVYVDVYGNIKSCVGTGKIYGKLNEGYTLEQFLYEREEIVGFDCNPRNSKNSID